MSGISNAHLNAIIKVRIYWFFNSMNSKSLLKLKCSTIDSSVQTDNNFEFNKMIILLVAGKFLKLAKLVSFVEQSMTEIVRSFWSIKVKK